jgi:hypothetical protein
VSGSCQYISPQAEVRGATSGRLFRKMLSRRSVCRSRSSADHRMTAIACAWSGASHTWEYDSNMHDTQADPYSFRVQDPGPAVDPDKKFGLRDAIPASLTHIRLISVPINCN